MKRRKKRFSLLREYSTCFNYLKESKNFIYVAIGIFFVFVLLGFFISPSELIRNRIIEFLKELFEETKGMSVLQLIRFIIWNNVRSSFFGIISGIVLGIFPVINAVVNGYLLGFVSSASVQQDGVLSLWRLFPHGIFEFPAVFISIGLGIKLGSFIFQKKKIESLKIYLVNSAKVFIMVIVPLLLIAGIIEGILIFFG